MADAIKPIDQEMLTRSITAVNAPMLLPIIPKEVPQGISSSISSIAKAEPKEVFSYSSTHPQLRLIQNYLNYTEPLTAKAAEIFEQDGTKGMNLIDASEAERAEELRKNAEAERARDSWNVFSKVAEYIRGIGTFTLGAAIGGIPGALLAGAGLLEVMNRTARDSGGLQKASEWWSPSEKGQKEFTQTIDTTVSSMQLGLAIPGWLTAWWTGGLTASNNVLEMVKSAGQTVSTASGIMNTSFKVGAEVYKEESSKLQASIKLIDAKITLQQQTLSQNTTQMSKGIESEQTIAKELQRMGQTLQISMD
jgi:hypothetical protein